MLAHRDIFIIVTFIVWLSVSGVIFKLNVINCIGNNCHC